MADSFDLLNAYVNTSVRGYNRTMSRLRDIRGLAKEISNVALKVEGAADLRAAASAAHNRAKAEKDALDIKRKQLEIQIKQARLDEIKERSIKRQQAASVNAFIKRGSSRGEPYKLDQLGATGAGLKRELAGSTQAFDQALAKVQRSAETVTRRANAAFRRLYDAGAKGHARAYKQAVKEVTSALADQQAQAASLDSAFSSALAKQQKLANQRSNAAAKAFDNKINSEIKRQGAEYAAVVKEITGSIAKLNAEQAKGEGTFWDSLAKQAKIARQESAKAAKELDAAIDKAIKAQRIEEKRRREQSKARVQSSPQAKELLRRTEETFRKLRSSSREADGLGLGRLVDEEKLSSARAKIDQFKRAMKKASTAGDYAKVAGLLQKFLGSLQKSVGAQEQLNKGVKEQTAERKKQADLTEKQLADNKRLEASLRSAASKKLKNRVSELSGSSGAALADLRRQLESFGTVGNAFQVRLRLKGSKQLRKIRKQIADAFAEGNTQRVVKLTAKLQKFDRTVNRVSHALFRLKTALDVSRAAFNALKASATFGLSVILSLAGGALKLAKAMFAVPFRFFRAGLKALFAPTLGLISVFRRLSSMMSLVFTGAIVFQIRNAVTEFAKFEDVLGRATGNLGVIGNEFAGTMDDFKSVVVDVAEETARSVGDVAAGLEELARGGVLDAYESTADKVRASLYDLRNTARLSLISGLGTAETGKLVSIIRNQFGLVGDEMDDLADTMAYLQKLGPITLNDIRTAIEGSGAAARNAGVSWNEYNALLGGLLRNLRSGSRAATALSRSLVQALVKPLKSGSAGERVKQQLRDMGIEMERFTDASGQRFREGGFLAYIKALSEARAGIGNLQEIFDFRSREFVNLLDAVGDGSLVIEKFAKELADAQKNDFSKKFAEDIKNKTFEGALRSTITQFQILKLTLSEIAKVHVTPFLVELRENIKKLSDFFDNSEGARHFFSVIAKMLNDLKDSFGPLLNRFAKIVAIVNTVLIGSIINLANKVANYLEPVFDKVTRKITEYLGLPANALDKWESTLLFISAALHDIGTTAKIAGAQLRILAIDAALALTESISKAKVPEGLLKAFDAIKSPMLTAATAIGFFTGKTFVQAMVAGMKSAIAGDTSVNPLLLLQLKKTRRLSRDPSLTQAQRDFYKKFADNLEKASTPQGQFQIDIEKNLADLKASLKSAGFEDALGNIFQANTSDEFLANLKRARAELEEYKKSLGKGVTPEALEFMEKLREETKRLEGEGKRIAKKLKDSRLPSGEPREFAAPEEKSARSQTVAAKEFQRILQEGDTIQQRQLNVAQDTLDELKKQGDDRRRFFGENLLMDRRRAQSEAY